MATSRASGRAWIAATSMALALAGALGALAPQLAQAQLSVNVGIGPPPPPRYEPVPAVPAGYVWAPGYWDWAYGTYVWRRGHLVAARPGYRWAPSYWEPGEHPHFHEGHLERDPNWRR